MASFPVCSTHLFPALFGPWWLPSEAGRLVAMAVSILQRSRPVQRVRVTSPRKQSWPVAEAGLTFGPRSRACAPTSALIRSLLLLYPSLPEPRGI